MIGAIASGVAVFIGVCALVSIAGSLSRIATVLERRARREEAFDDAFEKHSGVKL